MRTVSEKDRTLRMPDVGEHFADKGGLSNWRL